MLGYRNLTWFSLNNLLSSFPQMTEFLNGTLKKNYFFVRVEKVEKAKKRTVEIEVSPSGQYVANGFLIHNKRRGANMGILEIWHPDIEKFITAKQQEGKLENFNISVMITPDFWEYFESGKNYPLRNPRNGKVWKKVDPKYLFQLIASMAWKSGDPGVLFMDNINRRNVMKKAKGEIRSTNPCVTGDTLVVTDHGLVNAKDLKIGMKVWTLDGWKTITEVLNNGVQPVYLVEFENGIEIKVTADHQFMTSDGWKRIDELNPGDEVRLVLDDVEFENGISWNVEGRDDELVAEFLGYWCGDGSVSVSDHVTLYARKDKKLAEHLEGIVKGLSGNAYILNNGRQLLIDVHRKEFANFVRNIFNVEKSSNSKEKTVPDIILRAKKSIQKAFLRGLFSADGSVYDANGSVTISLSSSSKKLLKQVQVMLLCFGIPSTLTKEKKPEMKKIKGREYYTVGTWRLILNGWRAKRFYEKIGLLGLKSEKLKKLISGKKFYKHGNYKEFVRIKRIIYSGEEEVFDVKAPETYAWVTNGVYSKDCGEEPLYPYESCNLGSINLYAHVKFGDDGKAMFDWEEFKKTIVTATKFLDNIIDVNKFPFEKIEKGTKATRKIGLGFMGLADVLFALRIPYNSEEGFEFMRKVTEFLTFHAMWTSCERAKERGTFPLYTESSYVDGEMPVEGFYHKEIWTLDWETLRNKIKENGIRNAEVTTIAPTGSISMIVDVSSGLEPQFALIFEKRVPIGTFYYVDVELERQLKENGLYNDELLKKIAENGGSLQGIDEIPEWMKEVFVVAYDIPWWDHIRAQAEVNKWICAAVSKTINMPNWVTPEDVEKAYLFGYKLGVKGITIYREGSKSVQVLVTPSQRIGKYVTHIKNKTKEMMKEFGIELPMNNNNNNHGTKIDIPEIQIKKVKEVTESTSVIPSPEGKEVCPVCGSERLVYESGCVKCLDCGWSECIVA
ncbi:MAG: adenosylcobalamin-dependent ribonucleoside-diphosphate reductase [Candidatus Aenigmarchaeota archaeon]|nr:adenosylcobalamin-dependent ribonucleoside-diphosphate reductase [Candidatus Aenigmarchaeota archaeon]